MVRYGKCKSNILVRRWNGFAENFLVVVVVVLPTIVILYDGSLLTALPLSHYHRGPFLSSACNNRHEIRSTGQAQKRL